MVETINASTIDYDKKEKRYESTVVTKEGVRVSFVYANSGLLSRTLSIDVDWDNDGAVDESFFESSSKLAGSLGDYMNQVVKDSIFNEIEASFMLQRFGITKSSLAR